MFKFLDVATLIPHYLQLYFTNICAHNACNKIATYINNVDKSRTAFNSYSQNHTYSSFAMSDYRYPIPDQQARMLNPASALPHQRGPSEEKSSEISRLKIPCRFPDSSPGIRFGCPVPNPLSTEHHRILSMNPYLNTVGLDTGLQRRWRLSSYFPNLLILLEHIILCVMSITIQVNDPANAACLNRYHNFSFDQISYLQYTDMFISKYLNRSLVIRESFLMIHMIYFSLVKRSKMQFSTETAPDPGWFARIPESLANN